MSILWLSGALMITSGLLLHMCVCAMLIMKPYQPKSQRTLKDQKDFTVEKQEKTKIPDDKKNRPVDINPNESVKYLTASVLSNLHFILLLINTTMFLFGTAVVFTHLIAFAESQGISPSLGNMMISTLGFCALIGRIGLSSLSQHPKINTIMLYIVAVFLSGKYSFSSSHTHSTASSFHFINSSGLVFMSLCHLKFQRVPVMI